MEEASPWSLPSYGTLFQFLLDIHLPLISSRHISRLTFSNQHMEFNCLPFTFYCFMLRIFRILCITNPVFNTLIVHFLILPQVVLSALIDFDNTLLLLQQLGFLLSITAFYSLPFTLLAFCIFLTLLLAFFHFSFCILFVFSSVYLLYVSCTAQWDHLFLRFISVCYYYYYY